MLKSGPLSEQKVKEVLGDGAYDTTEFYELINEKNAKPNISIRKNAVVKQEENKAMDWRNQQITKAREKAKDKEEMKEELRLQRNKENHGKRSLVENCFSRLKAYFGDKAVARKESTLERELAFKTNILNLFT